ncbi:iron uptake transporter deferrochelatase/peroxidase subunit [Nocardioides sp. KR10-350]|uniref:iron uptake transporter deferrochelatase/peroxidase subunit n=1 Tax=Nocardioides cheoyonin TaxID=3156615 RepID=UPI0032B3DBEA
MTTPGTGCPFHPSPASGPAGSPSTSRDRGVSRRGLFGGALGAAASAPAAVLLAGAARGDSPSPSGSGVEVTDGAASYPFHGEHQAGILTPQQSAAAYVSFDVTAEDRAGLRELLQTLTTTARFLTSGGTPPDDGLLATAWDNGVVGPEVAADGLTVTASVGSSLFDDRFGLAKAKPARLRPMDEFPNDALDRSICDGDLLLQLCAHHPDTVNHAVRQLMRTTRGGLQVRWRQDGFQSPPRPSGTPRNLLGFKDGTANPSVDDAKLMDDLVWTHGGGAEPAWVEGGSYHVVRKIRMLVEFWDRVSVREQETMFGRDKASGAPLTGAEEFDDPDFGKDATGEVIRFDAHIRLANPRTVDTEKQRFLRRSFNYDAGTDPNGQLDMGLVFTAFNQDLERQFVTVQKRLIDEPLVDYISPVGGGYFFALPGVRSEDDWFGREMFT